MPRLFSLRLCTLLLLQSLWLPVVRSQNAIPTPPPLFSENERARIIGYWNEPGRYEIGVKTDDKTGPWVVRLTPEASIWFRAYNRVLRPGSLPPTQTVVDPLTPTERTERWESWVRAKLTYDRWLAQKTADNSNAALQNRLPAPPQPAPPFHGVMPPDLQTVAGSAPPFAAAVLPRRYTIRFDNGESIGYSDNISVGSPRYAYFRFAQGTNHFGRALKNWPERELNDLFAQAGFSASETRVAKAVSRLEGGFESVNTYDTGFVSVGFIQFASLETGSGSLGPVLKWQKQTRPQDFARDFRRFGIEVDDQSTLVVVDPSSGAEVRGPEANLKIIDDKRLTAVFQRAGLTRAFQIAQIQMAKQRFYPAQNTFKIMLNGQEIRGAISDVIRSEAGMATLFDRSVNAGNIRIFSEILTNLMTEKRLTRLEQAHSHELELIKRLKWRENFLLDPMLSQPK